MNTDESKPMGGEIASGHGRPGLLSSRTSGVPLPDHFFSDGFAAVGESLGGITDATPALIAYMDPGCRYRFVNAQYSLWFDRPREEILGLHMTDVLGVDAYRKLEPYLRKALKGEDVHFEMEVPYRKAGTRFITATYHPHLAEDGSVLGLYVLVIDISAHKRAEAALRQTEARLMMAMEAGQMGTWEWNLGTGEVKWSATLEKLHGLAVGSFGGGFSDFERDIHPADRDRVLGKIRESVERRTGFQMEYRIVRPDGSEVWMESRGKLFLDGSGEPERMAGLCMDVTARQMAQQAQQRSEQFNRTIIESSRDRIETISLSGELLWANRMGQRNNGDSDRAAAELGRKWTSFWLGENERLAEAAVRVAASGGTGTFLGARDEAKGHQGWWDVQVTPILDAQGKPERLLAISRDATERRRLEDVHARLAAVVESSEDAIISKTLGGIIRTWNRGAERMFGFSAAEMVGQPMRDLLPPGGMEDELKLLQRVARGEPLQTFETVRVHKDGQRLDVSLTVSPIWNSGGEIVGASTIARDITQRKQADAERARLASVLEKSLNEIYIFDTEDLRFLYVNEGGLKNLGYAMETMRQMTPMDIKPNVTREKFREWIDPLMGKPGEKLILHTNHRRADGSLYPVEAHVQCIDHATGRVFVAVILDITERRQAEEERERLLESEQLARAKAEQAENRARFLAEASASLAATLDFEETIGNLAKAAVPGVADWCAVHLKGHDGRARPVATAHFNPAKIALAKALQERFPDEPDSPYGVPAVLSSGRPQLYPEITDENLAASARSPEHLEILRGLGLVSALIVPMIANGVTLGAITLVAAESGRQFTADDLPFAEDLAGRAAAAAENARLYQEVHLSNAAKDHFLAVLSNELRTPLNPVLMTMSELEQDDSLPPAVLEQVRVVRRNVELEARLIDDLLDSTRIANGKLQLQRSVVDAGELVRRALAIVEREAHAKEIALSMIAADGPVPVLGDPARLQQVFWNVVKNAVKFTPEGGWVRVRCEVCPDKFRVFVEDNGIGIELPVLGRIFNAFEQGDARITHRFGGLGLGLAISKSLVELHDGVLTAQSGGPGLGATFIVELPLTRELGQPRTEGPVPPPHRALRMLVVEDHPDTAGTMARLLTRRGYTVTLAGSVAEALEKMEGSDFDLLISDLGLPDGSGLDLIREVRRTSSIPAIALSGYGTNHDLDLSRDAGFAAHLTKPIDFAVLIRQIQAIAPSMPAD